MNIAHYREFKYITVYKTEIFPSTNVEVLYFFSRYYITLFVLFKWFLLHFNTCVGQIRYITNDKQLRFFS